MNLPGIPEHIWKSLKPSEQRYMALIYCCAFLLLPILGGFLTLFGIPKLFSENNWAVYEFGRFDSRLESDICRHGELIFSGISSPEYSLSGKPLQKLHGYSNSNESFWIPGDTSSESIVLYGNDSETIYKKTPKDNSLYIQEKHSPEFKLYLRKIYEPSIFFGTVINKDYLAAPCPNVASKRNSGINS